MLVSCSYVYSDMLLCFHIQESLGPYLSTISDSILVVNGVVMDRNSTIPAGASKQKKIEVDLFHKLSVNTNMSILYVCPHVQMSLFD